MLMKEISLNQFKVHLAKFLAEAVEDGGLLVKRYNKPYVKIMPYYSLEDDPNVTVAKPGTANTEPLDLSDSAIDFEEVLKILREDRDA